MEFVKWPKVQQLHNVRKGIKARERYHEVEGLDPYQPPTVTYRGKVKLDGTNAAIRVTQYDIAVQSRSRHITPNNDNMGFARWVEESGYGSLLMESSTRHGFTLFGEWCGEGIQKRTAISKIPKKVFAVFAKVSHTGPGGLIDLGEPYDDVVMFYPAWLKQMLPEHEDVFILPWEGEKVTVDFGSRASLEAAVEFANQEVARVEACDPFVKEVFGVEGLGEGLVYYPLSDGRGVSRTHLGEWGFKAKGEEHQVVKQKAPVIIDPEVVATIDAFVEKFVTKNRLEQGLREACDGDADSKKTGSFMKWFGQDVKSESNDELEAAGLDWKDVSKAVMTAARKWWLDECKRI